MKYVVNLIVNEKMCIRDRHKSLSLYQEDKKDLLKESFKTVEGRFKEIHFNRSLDQNYQIISFTLKKKIKFENIYNKFYNDNISFYTQLDKLNLFDETDKTLLYKGCFPFNPISVYALVPVSYTHLDVYKRQKLLSKKMLYRFF